MYLVRGLKALHIRKRVAKEQDSWRTMQEVFNTINHITRMEERTKIYLEPNFESVLQVSKDTRGKYRWKKPSRKTYNGPQCTNSNFRSSSRQYNSQLHRDQGSYQPNSGERKLACYYHKGNIMSGTEQNLLRTRPSIS